MKKIFFLVLLFVIAPLVGRAENFEIDPSSSLVQFTSHPPLKVVGKTNDVKGFLQGSLTNPASLKGTIEVRLDSLDTRIKQRNKTMRNKFLETKQYPLVVFNLKKVLSSLKGLSSAEAKSLDIEGEFDLHGVKHIQKITVQTLYDKTKGQLELRSRFPMLLSDYNIKRPVKFFFKFSNEVEIDLDLKLIKK